MEQATLRELWLTDYLLVERGLSDNTSRSYHFGASVLERFTGKSIFDVTTADYRTYVRTSDHSSQHKGTVLASLKSAHRFYCLENDLPMNGIMALSAPRAPHNDVDAVTVKQARCLMSVCRHELEYRLVYCGLFAGLRINETAEGIREIEDDRIKVFGKGRKWRTLPLHSCLVDVLRETQSCRKRELEYRVQVLKKRSGFYFKSHMLRGGFANQLKALEVPHLTIKALLGHAGDLTASYTGGEPWRNLVEAVDVLTYSEIVDGTDLLAVAA